MAPVNHFPSGTTTLPPPAELQAVIAFRNASVFFVSPSPFAPYFLISKVLLRNSGRCNCGILNGAFIGSIAGRLASLPPLQEEPAKIAGAILTAIVPLDDISINFLLFIVISIFKY